MIEQPKHIPFNSLQELQFHIDASKALMDRLKLTIELWHESEGDKKEKLEEHITKSLEVLNDGYINMILSIQQGYIK
jgi:hypothetical protein